MSKEAKRSNKNAIITIATVIISCILMAVADGVLNLPYATKSAVKIVLFFILPVIYLKVIKIRFSQYIKPKRRSVIWGLILGAATFAVILGGYAILCPFLDLSAVPKSLAGSEGITKDNFIYVSVYISFCNSLLEEFFFRCFAFLILREFTSVKFAMLFSSAAFALYHVAIMSGWFAPWLFILIVAALFLCGLLFNIFDTKGERIWVSWLVHLFANLAINAIGMILLGII